MRKDSESVYVFDGDGDDDTRARHTRYVYEAAFGNVIRVEVRDADDKKTLRQTATEYNQEEALLQRYIGDRPSRAWVSDESGRCIAETRYAYDANGNLIKSEQPTTQCGESDAANLIVSRVEYDAVGNVTRSWTEGASNDIRTEFDSVFKLFPIRRYNANDNTLDETGKFYGVNGDDSRGEGGFWGAMQEFYGADGVCSQQAYDEFGRASHLWAKGTGYPGRDKAQTQWIYHTWGSMGQNANVIITQSLPRCEGNFVRKLYDGFGRLIQQQSAAPGLGDYAERLLGGREPARDGGQLRLRRPGTAAAHERAACGGVQLGARAGLGRRLLRHQYDALGRALIMLAPNGSMTSYHYNGLTSSVIGGDEWTLAAEISLNYDAADSLTQVYRRDGGEGRWQGTSSIGYDFLGRKTSMSDADLGNWSYAYNALGQLTRQTDARATSCLYYDSWAHAGPRPAHG